MLNGAAKLLDKFSRALYLFSCLFDYLSVYLLIKKRLKLARKWIFYLYIALCTLQERSDFIITQF